MKGGGHCLAFLLLFLVVCIGWLIMLLCNFGLNLGVQGSACFVLLPRYRHSLGPVWHASLGVGVRCF